MSSTGREVREPPRDARGIFRMLGPGLILAGGIVGSGELIAATHTGAKAGFIFLGLIIFGCIVKCFTQVEMARHAIAQGETTLSLLNRVPGPRVTIGKIKINWIVLMWGVTMLVGLGQLGGIVGGVGQAMATTVPITEHGRAYNRAADLNATSLVVVQQLKRETDATKRAELEAKVAEYQAAIGSFDFSRKPYDDRLWAVILAGMTMIVLTRGGFGFIEGFAAVLVALFTLVTVINLFALQSQPDWSISGAEVQSGLGFGFLSSGSAKLGLALSTFGIIGVGASEIVGYPYWCLEKGYGRWTGPRREGDTWRERARGWLRVMQWDAWLSMVVYTFCTIVFYLLGAAVLSRLGLVPEKQDLIRTLSVMYAPVFGGHAQWIFLLGAVAVLYSTFFISNATKCRLFADLADVAGVVELDDARRACWVRRLGYVLPGLCVLVYLVWPNPGKLVIYSGLFQSLLLPALGFAVLWLRYREKDSALLSGRVWDVMLWLSFLSFVGIGLYLAITKLGKIFG